jgi:hypothetical protein
MKPIGTDPKLNAKAEHMLQTALRKRRRKRTYEWILDHGLLAVVLLCTFAAGFVFGAVWSLRGGY